MTTTYTFTVNSFRITDTRSVHKDSDYVAMAVAVGNAAPITVPTKSMGDLNNGTFPVNLSIEKVVVNPTDRVAFHYSITNTGFDKNVVESSLEKAASAAAGAGTKALGPASGAASSVIDKIIGIPFANCDGVVADGTHIFLGSELATLTAGGKVYSVTDNNKGTDSPWGCGSNSQYYTTWSIAAHVI